MEQLEDRPRTVKGKEQYVVAGGQHDTLMVFDVEGRQTPKDLEKMYTFQNGRVFLRNKNFQSVPSALRGNVVYLAGDGIIGQVIEAKFGRMYVQQLFPPPKERGRFPTTTLQEGYLLQQQVGTPLGEFNMRAIARELNDDGTVRPLTDTRGYSKCNVNGPDVILLNDTMKVPDDIRKHLDRNPWVIWTPRIARPIACLKVPVFYAYAKDPSDYTKVLTYKDKDGIKWKKGVVAVPKTTSKCFGSERYAPCCRTVCIK
jgi:hypothetical protein